MPPRRKRPITPSVPGLRWRKGSAYYEREHVRLENGRIFKSLGTRDASLAAQYAQAVNTLCDRGDWSVIERWRRDELHISDIARAIREGEYGRLKRLTAEGTRLGEAADRFLSRTDATRSKKTAHTYRVIVGLLRTHLGDDYPMADLSTKDAEAFLHSPKKTAKNRVWSARSQGNARTIYKALWRMVIEQEAEDAERAGAVPAVTLNPWKRAQVPEQRKTRHAFLLPEQWQKLIAHEDVAGTREAAFLGCACLAGLRQQEICHLRPVDVDLKKGLIHVVDRQGDKEWKTKTENSLRDVPIVPELRKLLERHFELGFAGKRFVFRVYDRDEPFTSPTACDWTERCFRAAGIRYGRDGDALTLHSLRHTFASWMASAGIPFHVIAELMGDTPKVVMDTYAHLAPHDKGKAMAVIEDASKVQTPNTSGGK